MSLKYGADSMSFLGTTFEKASYDIQIKLCEACALLIMQKHLGVLYESK